AYKDEILFSPEMGDFDMAVGKDIVSAFAGAADYLSFDLTTHPSDTKTVVPELSERDEKLISMYGAVRELRGVLNGEDILKSQQEQLADIFQTLRTDFQNDWLLPLEIYELTRDSDVLQHLKSLQEIRPKVAHLIASGLELID
ncbi:MAG: phenylalanine 4-monooxygenase, partial [Flavobacteriaceae bacterium]|nr:phenylalanine 4-monooxygenase [Flavobacteriaceae bacterium]